MPKKQDTRKRTEVKDLPKVEKKLSAGEMKTVTGGSGAQVQGVNPKPKPKGIAGEVFEGTGI